MTSSTHITRALLVSASIVCLIPCISHAQTEQDYRRLGRLSEQLALSDEQVQAITETLTEAGTNCAEEDSAENRHTCLADEKDKIEESIEAVLSSDQLEELQSLREEFGGCRPPQGSGIAALQDDLELSTEQINEIHETMSSFESACSGYESLKESGDCMKSQQEDIEAEMSEILSTEQLESLESLRAQRRGKDSSPQGLSSGTEQPGEVNLGMGATGNRPPPPPPMSGDFQN